MSLDKKYVEPTSGKWPIPVSGIAKTYKVNENTSVKKIKRASK